MVYVINLEGCASFLVDKVYLLYLVLRKEYSPNRVVNSKDATRQPERMSQGNRDCMYAR